MATTATERQLLSAASGSRPATGSRCAPRTPATSSGASRGPEPPRHGARSTPPSAAMREPLPAHKRAEILVRVAGYLGRRHEEVAQTISRRGRQAAEGGAGRGVARDVDVHVGRGRGAKARRRDGADGRLAGRRRASSPSRCGVPIGVVGAISPFNFPLNLVAHKIAPALAAGCAVVLKPASQTPLSALLLAELETEAGLPPGWLNVLVGPAAEIGDVLVEDERVKLITFTGSCEVGWKLAERAPRKRVNLELGNATPVIVEADARPRRRGRAARRATRSRSPVRAASRCSASTSSGPRSTPCSSASCRRSRRCVVGDPADEATDVGPLIDRGRARPRARLDRGGAGRRRRGAHGRRARRRAPAADRDRERGAGR